MVRLIPIWCQAGPVQRTPFLICLLWLVACLGCGGQKGPKRVPVRGSVEVESRTAIDGSISFLPVDGHRGPASNGVITKGAFLIPASEGPTAGPHLVIIGLMPLKSSSDSATNLSGGKPPRTKWEVKVEVEEGGLDHHFLLKEDDAPHR